MSFDPAELWATAKTFYVTIAPTWLALTQLMKVAQPRVTEFLGRLVQRVTETEDKADDARLMAFVGSFRYWLFNEFSDFTFRAKLPGLQEVRRMKAQAEAQKTQPPTQDTA